MKSQASVVATLSLLLFAAGTFAQLPNAPSLPEPDDRYKADFLLIIAHPDDDVLISGYLAKALLDEHKRGAAILCSSGDGGRNEIGQETGAALGQERILESRQALQFLGITNVWYMGGHDTPGQDVLWSLDNWNHGRVLDEIVRLVRLTRPEVIITMLPDYVAGENHDDHQAAGVMATEAFDLAGDPTAFPEQVAAPRDRMQVMSMTEGLHPWQPKKIYYFTDAFDAPSPYWHDKQYESPFRKNFLEGQGPEYSNSLVSPSRHVSYGRLAAEQQSFYLTQGGSIGKEALAKGDVSAFEEPTHFIFGKSLVESSIMGDVFDGVTPGPIPPTRIPGFQQQTHEGLSVEFGDSWGFYRDFWKAHNLEHVAHLLPVPEVAIPRGGTLHVPLLIRNDTENPQEVSLTAVLPEGWAEKTGSARYPVRAHEIYPAQLVLIAPDVDGVHWQEITWNAEANGRLVGTSKLRVLSGVGNGGLPQ
ncbi:MAG TPA: PIG-L family deacetylase [Terriglobia bacterium]|nr:PIG-L family deacetylase [Terriglobia bacterium]